MVYIAHTERCRSSGETNIWSITEDRRQFCTHPTQISNVTVDTSAKRRAYFSLESTKHPSSILDIIS